MNEDAASPAPGRDDTTAAAGFGPCEGCGRGWQDCQYHHGCCSDCNHPGQMRAALVGIAQNVIGGSSDARLGSSAEQIADRIIAAGLVGTQAVLVEQNATDHHWANHIATCAACRVRHGGTPPTTGEDDDA